MKLTDAVSPELSSATSSSWRTALRRPAGRTLLALFILALLLVWGESSGVAQTTAQLQTFVTIFLSIFIEAVPFLLAGSIVSGLIDVFVNRDTLYRFVPKNPLLASLAGGSLGLLFPVCECGVVPVTRRLYQKGLPVSMGIAFLLAAPVINPIVMVSTYAAFGWGPILWGRFILSFLIAAFVGFIFSFARPEEVLRPQTLNVEFDLDHGHDHNHDHHDHHHSPQPLSFKDRFWEAMAVAGDDFFDMGRYLVAGSMLAAGMQTLVPQQVLLTLGSGLVISVVSMMVLAFVLSVCSTVDAFLALAFVNTFTPASILAFLVFGPMVDIKSALMFFGVFKRRIVLYLILLPMKLTLFITIFLSLNVRW
jgi:uncharacterized membrane protein YraQ (UPF0718 family)